MQPAPRNPDQNHAVVQAPRASTAQKRAASVPHACHISVASVSQAYHKSATSVPTPLATARCQDPLPGPPVRATCRRANGAQASSIPPRRQEPEVVGAQAAAIPPRRPEPQADAAQPSGIPPSRPEPQAQRGGRRPEAAARRRERGGGLCPPPHRASTSPVNMFLKPLGLPGGGYRPPPPRTPPSMGLRPPWVSFSP